MNADEWVTALLDRHAGRMARPEFLKAIRALSARYVERRHDLPGRSVLDTSGKRAAFAAFYAPLHFLTVREIVGRLNLPAVRTIVDLGCGTGVASAAWALASEPALVIHGVDRNNWALDEARWNWRALEVRGRAVHGELGKTLTALAQPRVRPERGRGLAASPDTAILAAWSLNELAPDKRHLALHDLLICASLGSPVLVVEPLATRAAPWWRDWARHAESAGARADEWTLDPALPDALRELDEAAGFRREALTARTLSIGLR